EGLIVVPLYARQAPADLVGMMKDCSASLICCGDAALKASIIHAWPAAPPLFLLEEIFATTTERNAAVGVSETDPVAIIYTSGTSGEPKGVVLTAGNVTFMLSRTTARLELLMGERAQADRVF